jgi:uncharacterized membrane protein
MDRPVRLLRHLVETRIATRRRFTPAVLDRIQAAVAAAEGEHRGELHIAIETDLDAWSIISGKTSRQRALEVFAARHVWDTEQNNGVLIYILCADRAVEIVADRGFNGLVAADEWAAVCRTMEAEFRQGHWQQGAVAGVEASARLLARHFPGTGPQSNELADRPVLL